MPRPGDDERGAAAVEFALVVPVLMLLLFGIIDYGMFFANTLGGRDGARAAARQGVVENFAAGGCGTGVVATGADAELNQLACLAIDQANPIGGETFARVTNPAAWGRGGDLLVCVATVSQGVTGYVPFPDDKTTRARIKMRIEQEEGTPPKPAGSTGEAHTGSVSSSMPPGGWVSWCT